MTKKLIEAMKHIKVLEKRLNGNSAHIEEYASGLNTEKLPFETEEKQTQEVSSLCQANEDLMMELLKTKRSVEITNLKTIVQMGGKEYSISDLLLLKRRGAELMIRTYRSLSTTSGDVRLRGAQSVGEDRPTVIRFYKEKYKNDKLKEWMELVDAIDSRLEVINATTDVIED